jgi:hypothetical protein
LIFHSLAPDADETLFLDLLGIEMVMIAPANPLPMGRGSLVSA